MTSSIICSYCSTSNRAGARFCANCGTELKKNAGQQKAMFGRYTILRSLGKGGMGALYLASETIANRERLVVVKEMLDYYDSNDPQGENKASQRFEIEAGTLASLNVAGVPQIFDYFSEGGRNYIVMQFVEGKNLEIGLTHLDENDDIVHGRPYPVDQVRRWGVRLCKILEALAKQDVIHMDIKPANLILDKLGEIWLVDFGTAKAHRFGSMREQVGMRKSSVYGTIGYAPPEQVAGKPEANSDVFALAATLYHLMTDDDPRDQPYAFTMMDQLPNDVAKALKKALDKNLKDRVAAAEFGSLLDVRTTTGPVFRWQDGTTTQEPIDLVMTADHQWDEALDYFSGDAWSKWFKDLHRHDVLAQWRTTTQLNKNTNVALDVFLRYLDPAYPAPELNLPVTELNFGVLPWQTQRTMDIKVTNKGSGCLQGRFANIYACMQVEPVEFVTHDAQVVRVTLDSGALTPSTKPQKLYLNIEGGDAGDKRLPVIVTVPEPEMVVSTDTLHLGTTYRGKEMAGKFHVSNQGGSGFMGEVQSDVDWVKVTPIRFLCLPGKSYDLNVQVDTQQLSMGEHTTQLRIRAHASGWEQVAEIRLVVQVSAFRTFIKFWFPPLATVSAWTVYGGFLGAVLGLLGGRFSTLVSEQNSGLLVGAALGALIFVFPGMLWGSLGRLGEWRGSAGAQVGAAMGIAGGIVTGALSGAFVQGILQQWERVNSGPNLGFFGLLTGLLIGLTLGIVLRLMPRK